MNPNEPVSFRPLDYGAVSARNESEVTDKAQTKECIDKMLLNPSPNVDNLSTDGLRDVFEPL